MTIIVNTDDPACQAWIAASVEVEHLEAQRTASERRLIELSGQIATAKHNRDLAFEAWQTTLQDAYKAAYEQAKKERGL